MSEINTQRRVVVICCLCNKVRQDSDSWEFSEAAAGTADGDYISHGYCPDCVDGELERHGLPKRTR